MSKGNGDDIAPEICESRNTGTRESGTMTNVDGNNGQWGTPPCDSSTEVCLEDSDECVPEQTAGQQIPGSAQSLTGMMCGATGPAMVLIFFGLVSLRFVGPRRS